MTRARALLWGALTVGVLDLADAMIFFGLRGVPPARVLQSIASGLLGRAAFGGGLATAALGTLLHFFIALVIVAVFFAASRRIPALLRRPVLSGIGYGVLAYLVMSLVVVPLSAAATGPRGIAVVLNGLLIHMLGVGLPAALFARASTPPGS